MRLSAACCLFALPLTAAALQVQTLEVSRDDAVYHVIVNVQLDATPERVRARLLDVAVLSQLDPAIKSAQSRAEGEGQRVQTELEECLFGLCRRMRHEQQVTVQGNEITAHTVPGPGSSFRSGVAHWQLTPEGDGTRLVFSADTEPDLWLPPVVGPRLLMHQLRLKTEASLRRLEQLARE